MLAARLYAARDLRVENVDTPTPPEGWVLIESIAVGICGTDKAFYVGRYRLFKSPLILGHEVVGRIVEGPEELRGKIVVPEINFACGACDYCRSGLYTHCPYKKTLGIDFDGGMAEYFIAPINALHIVEGLEPEVAVEVEPLAALINALEQYPLKPSWKVAIIGTGNLAYLLLQLLRRYGFEPIIVARSDSVKRKFFEVAGACVIDVDEARKSFSSSFDAVFEVSGDPSALDLAIHLSKPRGVIHLKSTPGTGAYLNLTMAVVKELRIVCTRCGTFKEFRKAIELLRSGAVKPLITSIIHGIENSREALERALRREEMKVVLRIR